MTERSVPLWLLLTMMDTIVDEGRKLLLEIVMLLEWTRRRLPQPPAVAQTNILPLLPRSVHGHLRAITKRECGIFALLFQSHGG